MLNYLLILILLTFSVFVRASEIKVDELALRYQVDALVLKDFVNSYNYKCPAELELEQLEKLLNALDDDTELSVMIEGNRMDWRDIYVEARSSISCLTPGTVSKGY